MEAFAPRTGGSRDTRPFGASVKGQHTVLCMLQGGALDIQACTMLAYQMPDQLPAVTHSGIEKAFLTPCLIHSNALPGDSGSAGCS